MTDAQIPEFDDVLRLLWEQAQNGSVTATAALARELRARARGDEGTVEDELDKLVRGE